MYKRLHTEINSERDLRRVISNVLKEKGVNHVLIFRGWNILSSYIEKGRVIPKNLYLIPTDKPLFIKDCIH